MPSVSPIAEYLRINKAIPKHDKFGCHFFSPEGLYLGNLTKSTVNNYRVITLNTFGEGLKTMYTKSVAIGQRFAYVSNAKDPIGVSIVPVKTYMRKVIVDFFKHKNKIEDTEKTLCNTLDLIAIDEKTGVGLYETDLPYIYETKIINNTDKEIKHPKFIHKIN